MVKRKITTKKSSRAKNQKTPKIPSDTCKKCKKIYKNATQVYRHEQFKQCELFKIVDMEINRRECTECTVSFGKFKVESDADFCNVLLAHKKGQCRTLKIENYCKGSGRSGDRRSLMCRMPSRKELACSGCFVVFGSVREYMMVLKTMLYTIIDRNRNF